MQATQKLMIDLLKEVDKQYVIPVYQRNYDWARENCEQLLNDIIAVGQREEGNLHFIGSVVYIKDDVNTIAGQEVELRLVIDGQQRLTTLILIYTRLLKLIKNDKEEVATFNRIKNILTNPNTTDTMLKLKLRAVDKNNAILDYLINEIGIDPDPAKKTNLMINYYYLREQIKDGGFDLVKKGLERLTYIDVALERGKDDPQRIFESINGTGVRLSQGDLIRNYFLMDLDTKLQTRLYNEYWMAVEQLTKDKAKDGQNKITEFFRDFYTLECGEIIKIDNLYNVYKNKYSFNKNTNQLEDFLKRLKIYAQFYDRLLNPSSETVTELCIEACHC